VSLRDFQIRWILSSGVGMSLGFLAFMNFLFFLAFGLEFGNYWSEQATEGIENAEQLLRIGLAVGLPLAGAIFTATQTCALRNFGIRYWRWVFTLTQGRTQVVDIQDIETAAFYRSFEVLRCLISLSTLCLYKRLTVNTQRSRSRRGSI
jgi:hypothetical protein